MKKGLFNEQYGLRSAVISGRKTVTRRICKNQTNPSIVEAKWKIGEVIAVAQSYEDMAREGGYILANMLQDETTFKKEYSGVGWHNAMFTKAKYMPHRIKITNIRVERLQDISDEDCLKEGIKRKNERYVIENEKGVCFYTNDPILAFRYLIDKVSGKGTWDSNPWVFVYDFELLTIEELKKIIARIDLPVLRREDVIDVLQIPALKHKCLEGSDLKYWKPRFLSLNYVPEMGVYRIVEHVDDADDFKVPLVESKAGYSDDNDCKKPMVVREWCTTSYQLDTHPYKRIGKCPTIFELLIGKKIEWVQENQE